LKYQQFMANIRERARHGYAILSHQITLTRVWDFFAPSGGSVVFQQQPV
jgi:hypothetical protein